MNPKHEYGPMDEPEIEIDFDGSHIVRPRNQAIVSTIGGYGEAVTSDAVRQKEKEDEMIAKAAIEAAKQAAIKAEKKAAVKVVPVKESPKLKKSMVKPKK